MKLAVASGKGGTGKTTVATNLARVASHAGRSVAYLDCDVEEPNGALFLKPEITSTRPVETPVPTVDSSLCTGCGLCGEICRFSAIVEVAGRVLVFPEMCHGCGGCWLVCPVDAVRESRRVSGRLERGNAHGVAFVHGLLDVGEAMSPPVIRAVKKVAPASDLTIIDAPPGTTCPVITSVRDADFGLLVTEPTPFGLHDLKLAVEMVRALDLPFGVVLNRTGAVENETRAWCREEAIPILAELPDDRRVAEAYSRGEMACDALPEYSAVFAELLDRVESCAAAAPAREGSPVS
jgi:MinD superfamily P-loop ATPase